MDAINEGNEANPSHYLKIGLDIHGVLDLYPEEFSALTNKWVNYGHEVHILTGESWSTAECEVLKLGILYTHHFSIVDWNLENGTPMKLRDNGWWLDDTIWDSAKGLYAKRNNLDIHFDDIGRYAKWFPENCTFIKIGKNFHTIASLL